MLTRPFTRLVVAFGQRKVTQRQFVEELVLGVLILIPLGFCVGLISSRICTKIHFESIRSDIWTTVVVFLIGDILMEWLLPSLSCLPMAGVGDTSMSSTFVEDDFMMMMGGGHDDYYYTWSWLKQSYGMNCPEDFASSATLLSPDATAILFSLRLVFLCLGVHIGESLCFVALTGGIATGKSTVAQFLVDFNETAIPGDNGGGSGGGGSSNKRKPKRTGSNSSSNNNNNNNNNSSNNDDDYKEGTVNLICADSIAHQILLPPSILSGEEADDDDEDGDGEDAYIVDPRDSVYPRILDAFEGHDILGEDGKIDRLKLGSIIFNDPAQRRKLNRITHPKIIMVLLQRMLRGVFFGRCDITVADVPLLFESGKLSSLFAVTICVTVSDPKVQLERLMKRNPELSRKECQARIDSQLPLETKQEMADIVIDNTGTIEDLSDQVEEVRKDLMGRLYGIGMSLLQMLLLIGGSTSIAVSSKFYTHWQQ